MRRCEYLRPVVLEARWEAIQKVLSTEWAGSGLNLQEFFNSRRQPLATVGRVLFNLAENRNDLEYPFAFMVTYTPSLAARGVLGHLPPGDIPFRSRMLVSSAGGIAGPRFW